MAEEVKQVDYTTKDYEGYRADMIELIPTVLPEWTDRSDNDPGIAILELLAYQLEKQSYYNDRVANEVFLETATHRKSVIDHCRRIGYELAWHSSAKHYQVFEIAPQVEDTVIPQGFQIGTVSSEVEESVIFETLEDLIIPAGATGLEQDVNGEYLYKVEVEHGQTITDEYIGDVDGTTFQQFKLIYSPILKESIDLFVEEENGKYRWSKVDDFISSKQDSMHYTAEMNEFDEVIIEFGNGVSGRIPDTTARVYASYKVGGGIEGNVGANTIIESYEALPGLISTFNPNGPHVLGKDKESLEDAKWKGPANLKQMERYVTPVDFEEGILLDYEGIAKSRAVLVEGAIDLYLAPVGADFLTPTQKTEVLNIINDKKVIFTTVTVKDPTYVTVNISVNLMALDNYNIETIRYSASNILTEKFESSKMDFGKEVALAEIHYELMGIEGVKNVIINTPTADTPIAETQIAKLGTVTVTVNGL